MKKECMIQETLIETRVSYTIELQGQLYLIEQVPARACQETGEDYFSPETVEQIQALIKSGRLLEETPLTGHGFDDDRTRRTNPDTLTTANAE
jgi:YgiT-type zinc finger domain-containing protein